jgi:hypothetical protein
MARTLQADPLKTLVMSAGKGQGDEKISASRMMLQEILD